MHEENHNTIEEQKSTRSFVFSARLSMPQAVVITGVLIAGAILFSSGGTNREQALQDASARIVTEGGTVAGLINEVDNATDFIRGAKNPTITIVEFSDFGCSFCASFHPTLRDIVNKYPDDVAWVYRHLPFRNNEAALASECVGQKLGDEAFWKYSDELFANFPNITNELMANEAVKLGFKSEEVFWECQGSEKVAKQVETNAAEARLLGASGTPYSLVLTNDGKSFPLKGAASFEQVEKIVTLLIEAK